MASGWYNAGRRGVLDGTINLTSNTIKMLLVDDTHVPEPDDDFISTSIAADELSGSGYVGGFNGSGRKTIASKVFSTDDANDRAEMTADPVTWLAIDAGTAATAILVKEVSADSDSIPIAFLDHADIVTDGGDVTITADAIQGLIQLA